jgi:hypothetical protein
MIACTTQPFSPEWTYLESCHWFLFALFKEILWARFKLGLFSYGLFKCFLGQGSNVQSSKPNRSFSKNCPELIGKPSKIKFFWSFLLMSACDCKSRKFNFCNQFRVQQSIFERSFWIDLGVSANSSVSSQAISSFLVNRAHTRHELTILSNHFVTRETSSEVKTRRIDSQRNWQLVESSWQQNQELESPHLKSSDIELLNIEKY